MRYYKTYFQSFEHFQHSKICSRLPPKRNSQFNEVISVFKKNTLVNVNTHLEINIVAVIHQSVASFAGETQFVVATRI